MFTLRPHQQQILDALQCNSKGIVTCPTGGGKTFAMITDSRRFLTPGNVVVVVAPQLLLSQQLFTEFDKHLTDVNFMYRQISSEGKTFQRDRAAFKFRITPPKSPTTIIEEIRDTYRIAQKAEKPLILFVTYDSLERIVSSMIPVSAVYYDEAHNATSSDHFNAVKYLSAHADRNYFFTATPRYSTSRSVEGPGMDNVSVYGEKIANVKFSELVKQGVIVKPRLHLLKSDADLDTMDEVSVNFKTIKEVVNHYEVEHTHTNHKILFCAQGTKSINDLLAGGLQEWASSKGYKVLSIDSINQGYVNGDKKVNKTTFIKTLNELGADPNEKLIVLHYAMLGEGIDVKAFTGVVFLRNTLSAIFATQSMGRVIRSAPGKKYGIVTIVQHESNTTESLELIRNIVVQLISQGVPVSEIFTETSGRGKDEEIVEDLDVDELQRRVADYAIEFEHNNILEELLSQDEEEFSF
jgi:superfamily II DNA or RNA helicase